MSAKTTGLHHRIYLMDAKRDAREEGIYVLVATLIAAVTWLFGYKFISGLFLVGGGYFFLQVVGDFLAIYRHTKALERLDSGADGPSDSEEEGVQGNSTGRTIELGGAHPEIRVSYADNLEQTHGQGIERFLSAIESNKREFLDGFENFKQLQCKRYPRYAEFIPLLKIRNMLLLPGKKPGECRAIVWFSGELGEVWQTDFEDGKFSDLYSG